MFGSEARRHGVFGFPGAINGAGTSLFRWLSDMTALRLDGFQELLS
jgi:hypothetical protein